MNEFLLSLDLYYLFVLRSLFLFWRLCPACSSRLGLLNSGQPPQLARLLDSVQAPLPGSRYGLQAGSDEVMVGLTSSISFLSGITGLP